MRPRGPHVLRPIPDHHRLARIDPLALDEMRQQQALVGARAVELGAVDVPEPRHQAEMLEDATRERMGLEFSLAERRFQAEQAERQRRRRGRRPLPAPVADDPIAAMRPGGALDQ